MSSTTTNTYPPKQLQLWTRPVCDPAAAKKPKLVRKPGARTPPRDRIIFRSVYRGAPRPSLAAKPRPITEDVKEPGAKEKPIVVEDFVDDGRHQQSQLVELHHKDMAVLKWLADVMVREADPPLHYPVIWKDPTACEVFHFDDESHVEAFVPDHKRKRAVESDNGYFSIDESHSESGIESPRPMKRMKAATPSRMACNSAATTPTSRRSHSATYFQVASGTLGGRSSSFEKSV